ncbi:hypothetical protein BJY01DRAFT_210411 [Aspergillus pseudoustus]|uniref:Uncharacterized protein n=1 Tax=Aspergillus pseudoustus TaxID=1810923 RepID=A0ABR4KCG6_9EURO
MLRGGLYNYQFETPSRWIISRYNPYRRTPPIKQGLYSPRPGLTADANLDININATCKVTIGGGAISPCYPRLAYPSGLGTYTSSPYPEV